MWKRSTNSLRAYRQYATTTQPEKVKTGILMLNMGGPQTLEEVQPFLTRLFTDVDIMQLPFQSKLGPWIASRRTPKVQEKYAEIGGGSPILKWTTTQGQLLVDELNSNFSQHGPFKHYVGFRYADPLTEEAVDQIRRDGIERVVVFSQYPQYSCSTTGSSINQLAQIWSQVSDLSDQVKFSFIDRWSTNQGLVEAFADNIRKELDHFAPEERSGVVLLFSAHSLPLCVVDTGDTYPSEVGSTVLKVMEELQHSNPYRLVYQSKVGPKRWLGPQTEEVIKSYAKKGHQNIVIIPISFVNEHIETLHELDIEYGSDLIKKINIKQLRRAPAPNDHPKFIKGMADLVKSHIESGQVCSPQLMTRCPHCTKSSCKDARDWLRSVINK